MNQPLHTAKDEYSGRPITQDAWTALEQYRATGAVKFESLEIPFLRDFYVESSRAAALQETVEIEVTDYDRGDYRVRLYEPRPVEQRDDETPAILFAHGGGWTIGNLETHDSPARRLAIASGFPVVAVDYRLAPEHPYPAAIEDCCDALRWLADASSEHGVDASSLNVVGDSAGGQLAAVLANECADDDSLQPLLTQSLIYPAVDLTEERIATGGSYQRLQEGYLLVKSTSSWFINNYVGEVDDRSVSDISPLYADLPSSLPATYIVTVDNDPLANEGIEYAGKLALAGANVTHRHLPGYHHGIINSAGAVRAAEEELGNIAEFIRKHNS